MKRFPALALILSLFAPACHRHSADDGKAEEGGSEVAGGRAHPQMAIDEGCPHGVDGQCSHGEEPQPDSKTGKASAGHFGKPLGASPPIQLAAILSQPEKFHEKSVLVEGHVSRACSRKGCWMELAVDSSEEAERCRVTFENYSFFVPRDSAGSHARLEGLVQVTQVQPDAVRHYESEGAKFPSKQPDGSAREVRLIATGVELERI